VDYASNTETTKSTVVKVDTQAPTAPASLSATLNPSDVEHSIQLNWSPTDDVNLPAGSGFSKYRLARSQDGGSYAFVVDLSTRSQTSYTDTGLSALHSYAYN